MKKISEIVTPQMMASLSWFLLLSYLSPLDINSQKEILVVGILRVNHHSNYSAQLLPISKKKIGDRLGYWLIFTRKC